MPRRRVDVDDVPEARPVGTVETARGLPSWCKGVRRVDGKIELVIELPIVPLLAAMNSQLSYATRTVPAIIRDAPAFAPVVPLPRDAVVRVCLRVRPDEARTLAQLFQRLDDEAHRVVVDVG